MGDKCTVKYQIQILQGVDLQITPRVCGREAIRDDRCICHLDDDSKPLEPIRQEIGRMLSDGEDLDCSMFVFPKEEFAFSAAIPKRVFFENCKFYGAVKFKSTSFREYTSFHGTQFFGDVDFHASPDIYRNLTTFHQGVNFTSTTFRGDASFRACIFGSAPEFNGTEFWKLANFAFAWLGYGATSDLLEFRLVKFLGQADLHFRGSDKLGGVAFRFCDLTGLRISSIPRDRFRLEFEEISNWKPRKRQVFYSRIKIRDELQNGPAVELVDTYRFLEKYFFDHSDFALASQFHVGLLVAERRTPNYRLLSRFLNRLYQITSNYGESILRPILSLLIVWLTIPLVLLFLGMPVNRPGNDAPVKANWIPTSESAGRTWVLFWNDYKSAFSSNLVLSTIDRKTEFSPPSDSLQKVILLGETALNVIFLSFLVLGTRRKFTPKKPTGL
jgi:hypothetical protein